MFIDPGTAWRGDLYFEALSKKLRKYFFFSIRLRITSTMVFNDITRSVMYDDSELTSCELFQGERPISVN